MFGARATLPCVFRAAVLALIVAFASVASACEPAMVRPYARAEPDPTFTSADGHYVARLRGGSTPVLYEVRRGRRHRIRKLPPAREAVAELLVADDGVFVVVVNELGFCGYPPIAGDNLLSVYSGNRRIGALTLGDVFTPYDVHVMRREQVTFALREGAVVIAAGGTERRIDLATAQMLDPKTPVFPWPHVYASAATTFRELQPPPPRCAAEWDDPNITRVETNAFYARATTKPLPAFPELMIKANIRGSVLVDVLVASDGHVLCTRASNLPFGGTEAATNALSAWSFEPAPAPYAGQLLVSFVDALD